LFLALKILVLSTCCFFGAVVVKVDIQLLIWFCIALLKRCIPENADKAKQKILFLQHGHIFPEAKHNSCDVYHEMSQLQANSCVHQQKHIPPE
jgi:hypothetical protein